MKVIFFLLFAALASADQLKEYRDTYEREKQKIMMRYAKVLEEYKSELVTNGQPVERVTEEITLVRKEIRDSQLRIYNENHFIYGSWRWRGGQTITIHFNRDFTDFTGKRFNQALKVDDDEIFFKGKKMFEIRGRELWGLNWRTKKWEKLEKTP